MKAISSADINWGIGYKGQLLKRVPRDMQFFKEMTLGKVVVMGKGTFLSLPNKQPLKDRTNIILSKSAQYNIEGLVICRSISGLFKELEKYPPDDIFIIGGESIFTQLLPFCSESYITRFEKGFLADRHFPNLDMFDNWVLAEESEGFHYEDFGFRFLKYINMAAEPANL
ncbi:MAG: dihydrofolate reductase [Clostridiales bacterium]|nr:dihydrofolate reductase [Clostridiales bacterium]